MARRRTHLNNAAAGNNADASARNHHGTKKDRSRSIVTRYCDPPTGRVKETSARALLDSSGERYEKPQWSDASAAPPAAVDHPYRSNTSVRPVGGRSRTNLARAAS